MNSPNISLDQRRRSGQNQVVKLRRPGQLGRSPHSHAAKHEPSWFCFNPEIECGPIEKSVANATNLCCCTRSHNVGIYWVHFQPDNH